MPIKLELMDYPSSMQFWEGSSPIWLREIPAIRTLHKVWIQNYTWRDENKLRLRQSNELRPATIAINSPFDDEVRFCVKRQSSWIGYKVHLTETCDDQFPRIITEVKTTLAPIADGRMTTPIHEALKAKDLLPGDHLVDIGYVDAELFVTSQQSFGVNLVDLTRLATGWQIRQGEGGFTAENFKVDWEQKQATCPAGKISQSWQPALDTHGHPVIHIRFSKADYGICSLQPQCIHSHPPRRTFTAQPQKQQLDLQAAREREKTDTFKKQYAPPLVYPKQL